MIDGSANGVPFGHRTIKAMGKGTDDWFVELTGPFCQKAKLAVGDAIDLHLRLA